MDKARALLEVKGLQAWYGESHILHGVDFSVREGEVVTLLGRNGAGKTTLLKAIMGSMPAYRGKVLLNGVDVTRTAPFERARGGIGYVPQGRGIFPRLSVYENLLMGLESVGGVEDGQLAEVYGMFPVLQQMAGRVAGVLSGGQQQQLAIGRALMGRPTLLLLDEPTEGIQPNIVAEIEAVIGSLRGKMAVVLVEQFLGFALANADHCYVLERGAVTLSGAPGDLSEARLREALAI